MLRNLIGNAVKYTSAGSVTVEASVLPGELLIGVRDTGPGIPRQEQKKIFEEYVQLVNPGSSTVTASDWDSLSSSGSTFCWGCRLSPTSSVGVGSVFAFHVPLADQQTITVSVGQRHGTHDFRTASEIWLLDDDLDVVEALDEQLHVWGAESWLFRPAGATLAQLHVGVQSSRNGFSPTTCWEPSCPDSRLHSSWQRNSAS